MAGERWDGTSLKYLLHFHLGSVHGTLLEVLGRRLKSVLGAILIYLSLFLSLLLLSFCLTLFPYLFLFLRFPSLLSSFHVSPLTLFHRSFNYSFPFVLTPFIIYHLLIPNFLSVLSTYLAFSLFPLFSSFAYFPPSSFFYLRLPLLLHSCLPFLPSSPLILLFSLSYKILLFYRSSVFLLLPFFRLSPPPGA